MHRNVQPVMHYTQHLIQPIMRLEQEVLMDGSTVLDEGNNNTCINCHQTCRARSYYHDAADQTYTRKFTGDDVALYTNAACGPNGTDSVVVVFDVPTATHDYISSTHAGPHHGTQGNLWAGLGGVTVGTMYNGHSNGCVECHMADGAHSFKPNSATCIACHSDGTDKQSDMDDFADRIEDIWRCTRSHTCCS